MGTRLRVLPYDHALRGVTVDQTHQDLFDYGRSRSGEDRAGGRRNTLDRRRNKCGHGRRSGRCAIARAG